MKRVATLAHGQTSGGRDSFLITFLITLIAFFLNIEASTSTLNCPALHTRKVGDE
jgi:hypothetical protein